MGAARFYALLSTLLFAAVCAYAGAAVFTALETEPGEALPLPVISREGELSGIILRREEKTAAAVPAFAGERIAPGEHSGESALYFPYCDGYESLSPADASAFSAQKLSELMHASPEQCDSAKLIYGFDCYYAAFYSGLENMEPGPCRIRFEGEDKIRRAELMHVSQEEAGCVLLFRLMLDTQLSALRFCSAQLIY